MISCLEDVRITEPFTFYPSQISLSVEPLGNVLNASDKIFSDEVIKVVESNLDYSIHNKINHVHGHGSVRSLLWSEDIVIVRSFQMFLDFLLTT